MGEQTNKRLLIVSNNALSERRNNGKTVVSFIDTIDKQNVRQLYFHPEKPTIAGYSYFQISDIDVMKGKLSRSKRGRVITHAQEYSAASNGTSAAVRKKTPLKRILRDLLWWKSWRSPQLLRWLDEYKPETLFFVAGDAGFPYSIVKYLHKKYQTKLVTYITDDYIMPRSGEGFLSKLRRKSIRRKMVKCVGDSDCYYTVSPSMSKEYAPIMGKESKMLVNMSESLYDESERGKNDGETVFIYAGSLYYGRDKVIAEVASALQKYNAANAQNTPKAVIHVYTNTILSDASAGLFGKYDCCEYCGSVGADELKKKYNRADVLLFVESFDSAMIEKTKYSLSTKVPEYLSLKKPILAVGPKSIGSMDYLEGCAVCVNDLTDLNQSVVKILTDEKSNAELSGKAYEKFCTCHNKKELQSQFIDSLLK